LIDVSMFVSQPFVTLPSQSLQPASHATPQAPPVHAADPFVRAGQTCPHEPQFDVDDRRSAHAAPHSVLPPVQIGTQPPERHSIPDAQTFPHAPQFVDDVRTSAQLPPQRVVPPEQLGTHVPPMQSCAAGHTRPHVPQWVVVSSGDSHPFASLPSQFPKPVAQLMTHTLLTHIAVP
jgi:hypothetical protein